jgi:hypothetical protein
LFDRINDIPSPDASGDKQRKSAAKITPNHARIAARSIRRQRSTRF